MAPRRRSASIAARESDTPTAPSSRERLLDAGERLFAEHGYDGVALRAIAEAAGVNIGTIPYFFGTKENLFKQVLLRRVEPIQRERHGRLDALMKSPGTMTIESILAAMLEPVFRESREHASFRKLAARTATDPAPEVRKIIDEIYDVGRVLTPRAMRMVCPHLSAEEFYWRLTCLYGAMFYIQADTGHLPLIAGGAFDMSKPDAALPYLIPAFAAFFRAPAQGGGAKRSPKTRAKPR